MTARQTDVNEDIQDRIPESTLAAVDHWNARVATEISCSVTHLFWKACVDELMAFKPGNVHCYADGHGMTVEDFLMSAHAVSGVMANPEYGLAEKIKLSVMATQAAVSKNTNLGIILLCMPIAQACLSLPHKTLRRAIVHEIDVLNKQESELILEAIRLANPSGLGESPRFDVRETARAPIRKMMAYAEHRDLIARQYAGGYREIFEFGIPNLRDFSEKLTNESDRVTALYLAFMNAYADSHILRQHGIWTAGTIQQEAIILLGFFLKPDVMVPVIDEFFRCDASWKRRNINPGTSADLTVATLFANGIENKVN